uniref:Uncharacterized protein n=1 Tax=Corethron hystrix TaxID=216773 RepID=A0A7S1FY88_9STRA|mmetsp:Transcript_41591/g.97356  ORF Transcript_41591/g.97356 Transcript_41591/m.97356 type:complete len:251 (+) Transcript_41591:132-884(+)
MYAHKISICLTAIIVSVLTWSTDAQVSQNNLRINSQLDNPELLAFAEDVERRIAGNDKNKSNSKKNNNKDNKNEEDKEKEKREAEAKMRETAEPSSNPTQEPTTPPTSSPSISPTISPKPTESPTTSPSKFPTLSPTPLFDRKLGETCSGDGSCLSGNCFKPATSAPHGVCQCNLCTEIGGCGECTGTFETCQTQGDEGKPNVCTPLRAYNTDCERSEQCASGCCLKKQLFAPVCNVNRGHAWWLRPYCM